MIARAILVPAFGLAVACCYAAAWLFLERAFTPRALTAVAFVALAGAGAALVALLGARLLITWPWTARFAATLLALTAGTTGLTALLLGIERAWATHPMAELPIHAMLLVVLSQTAAALYNVLALAGFLLLPLGLPTMLLFAWVLARRRCCMAQTHRPFRSRSADDPPL